MFTQYTPVYGLRSKLLLVRARHAQSFCVPSSSDQFLGCPDPSRFVAHPWILGFRSSARSRVFSLCAISEGAPCRPFRLQERVCSYVQVVRVIDGFSVACCALFLRWWRTFYFCLLRILISAPHLSDRTDLWAIERFCRQLAGLSRVSRRSSVKLMG